MANPSFTLPEIQQLQSEGLVLRYPDVLMNAQLTLDGAVSLLLKAAQQALLVPFIWSWIDRTQDGQTFIIFLPPHTPFPLDGIRWSEAEHKFSFHQGTPKELEVYEIKHGFIPRSGETMATRVRRRYRLVHPGGLGAMPQLWVVHYTRGPLGHPVVPGMGNQPVRIYPLRQITEPPMYVAGDKLGQKAFPGGQDMGGGGMPSGGVGIGAGMPGGMSGGMPGGMAGMQSGIGGGNGGPMVGGGGMPGAMGAIAGNMSMPGGAGPFNQQQAQAMLAQQNSNMEMLEARRTHSLGGRGGPLPPHGVQGTPGMHGPPGSGPHGRGMPPSAAAGVPPGRRPAGAPGGLSHLDDDDSGDEVDTISTRTLALTRYKQNHDWMNEVFVKASFGVQPNSNSTSPYGIFNQNELDAKIAKLSSEIEALQARTEELKRQKGSQTNSNEQIKDHTIPLSSRSPEEQLLPPESQTMLMDTTDAVTAVDSSKSMDFTAEPTAANSSISAQPAFVEGIGEEGVPAW
ncbi:hypothetical protein C8R42DRAFT_634304 [Lentinula raphanica]|nr:hypothetical protein C8R42DRAFT_634304 [Lentinula raphanica]